MKKFSALIVDDSEDIHEIIEDALNESGNFSFIVHAKDGQEAMMKMANQKFDIILLDLSMPRMNGIELAKSLKSTSKTSKANLNANTKIVIISGTLDSDNIKAMVALGIKDILVKPFNQEQLLDKCMSMLKAA